MTAIGWLIWLGLIGLTVALYFALPVVAIVIVVLLLVGTRTRRIGGFIAAATLAIAAIAAPWINWGFDSEIASIPVIAAAVVLYVGQIAIACLLAAALIRICIWLWCRIVLLLSGTTKNG